MALDAYLRLVGANQGQLEGDVRRPGREKTIAVTAYAHVLGAEERQGALRPRHAPVTVTKDVDHVTPQLAIAYATREAITDFELQFVRLSQWGQEEHVYTVELSDARIHEIRQTLSDTRTPDAVGPRLHERVTFTYASIDIRWELGKGEVASVSWPS